MSPRDYQNQDNILEEALKKFVDAHLGGEQLDIDIFVEQYPECEELLRQRIQDLQKINNLFDSLVEADESDFEVATACEELVGKKINSFEIIEIIGRGGMGVVYLARDTKLERSVAIKSMPSKLTDDSTTRMRLSREAKLLASLNHPNIAVIHEIIEQKDGAGYLVLEYVPGETLAEHIARKPLTLEQALLIGQQIAEAVSAAHKKGVVHRDLKPGNVKLTPEGRVKVLDFGLAKPSTSEGKKSDITVAEPGRVIGTPAYMSPEQARGQPTDHRTDIWSFGCIMYQMLTGKLPFEAETASDTLAQIIERQPDWEALPQETPANMRALLQRCLEKEPDRRLDDIGDVAIEIAETLSKAATAQPMLLRRIAMIISAVAFGIILSGIALKYIPKKEIQLIPKRIRLVVVPFENLGPAEDEYFADGITDEITARLASIHGLGVISRQSAMQYKKSEKGTQEIADELSVDYILEGTVRREQPSDPTSRVRIIPQLIRASDDTHIWVQTYDNDMSKVFQVQSELAEQVAKALDITLFEPERRALRSYATENTEAYNYYIRGKEYFYRDDTETTMRLAIRMFKMAIELDSKFALSYTQLSMVYAKMYWLVDPNYANVTMAKDAAEKALELSPDLPEVHKALGCYYYWCLLDYDRALEEFTKARKKMPNNAQLLAYIAFVYRRQGEIEKAKVTLEKAIELNPQDSGAAYSQGQTLMLLRKYQEAEPYFDRAIQLAPHRSSYYDWKAHLYTCWQGNTEKARAVLDKSLQNIGPVEDPDILFHLVLLEIFDEKYQEALDRLSSGTLETFESQFYFIPRALLYARINGLMGNRQLEQAYYESARSILESKIREQPEDARFHGALGIAYAGLGRKEDALREGKLGVKLLPVSKEAWRGLYRVEDLARIYVMVGEFDAAIDQLDFLLSKPGGMSVPLLRLDPAWDSLRDHPRFKKLIETGK